MVPFNESTIDQNEFSEKDSIRVPPSAGLWINLSPEGHITLSCELDARFEEIHPNCYAPASLNHVALLKGGGSGTAVFEGEHPRLHSLVMKHGGAKDISEVFSLAAIAKELSNRGGPAAVFMKARIPEFVGLYISPRHLRDRAEEIWDSLRREMHREVLDLSAHMNLPKHPPRPLKNHGDMFWKLLKNKASLLAEIGKMTREDSQRFDDPAFLDVSGGKTAREALRKSRISRDMIVRFNREPNLSVQLLAVVLDLPAMDTSHDRSPSYACLDAVQTLLKPVMETQNWKFTLAQKRIGGPSFENGATVLVKGKLVGVQWRSHIEEFTNVVKYLRALTQDDERAGFKRAQAEVTQLRRECSPVSSVSKFLDAFVGSSIIKNFSGRKRRFAQLRLYGEEFREKAFLLSPAEEVPGKLLAMVLHRGASFHGIFLEASADRSALDILESSWLDLLEEAMAVDTLSAKNRLWTCGLSDAGLHNSFISPDKGLELFDLGEPSLVSEPAFLTKFLMSYFHTLGMEEDDDGIWIRRFQVADGYGRLALTPRTKELVPYIFDTFDIVINYLLNELFDNDVKVRRLLIRYTVLQILSDASFCLGRWEKKGGGCRRTGNRVDDQLHDWLWRALWDVFIASEVWHRYRGD